MQKIILFMGCILCFLFQGLGQSNPADSLRTRYDESYGLDALLTNGKKYIPQDLAVKGHPFWKSEDVFPAIIIVSGHTFPHQQLKYDLNRQQFVLFYSNYNGQPGQIILHNQMIDSLYMGNSLFIPNSNPSIRQPFVQLISKGILTCTIAWSKDLVLNTMGQNVGYEYSKQHSQFYLNYKGSDYKFSNKASFLRIFNPKERADIRKYLSSNRLKFKKINDHQLRELIIYCEQTLNN